MNILSTSKDNYKRWEEEKLEHFSPNAENLMVEITNSESLKKSEK